MTISNGSAQPTRAARLTPPDPRPFVKWAGGKGTLVGDIAERFPRKKFDRYFEPFVGAGAMFFWMRRSYPDVACSLADTNEELVNAYVAVRDHVEQLLAKLEVHRMMHGKQYYYEVRSKAPHAVTDRAARFIYLNRTCFNGLYRVNRQGGFNVPMGRYANPRIVDRDNLLAVSHALRGVSVEAMDFEAAVSGCGEGDLIYLDPPYHPISATSHFTNYTSGGFGPDEQKRLASLFAKLARKGASVILSNSDTEFTRDLYGSLDPKPVLDRVDVPRSINSKAGKRGPIAELLVWHAS